MAVSQALGHSSLYMEAQLYEDGQMTMKPSSGYRWLGCFLVDNWTDMKEYVRAALAIGN